MGFSRQEYWSGVPLPSPTLPWVASNQGWGLKLQASTQQVRGPVSALLIEAAPGLGSGEACRCLLCPCHFTHGTYVKATLEAMTLNVLQL